MKGVAIQAIFLIITIMIFLFFISAVFFKWIDITKLGSNQAACRMKILNYCSDWRKSGSEPKWWDDKPVENCTKPVSFEDSCQID